MAGRRGDAADLATWRGPQSFTAWVPLHHPPDAAAETAEATKRRWESDIERGRSELSAHCEALGDIHSMRLVITPEIEDEGRGLGLLLNVVHDGSDDRVVRDLAPVLRKVLDPILPTPSEVGLVSLLEHYELRHHTMFIGNINGRVQDIRAEARLFEFLQAELDARRRDASLPSRPEAIRLLLQAAVRDGPAELVRDRRAPESGEAARLRRVDVLWSMLNPLAAVLFEDIMLAIGHLDRGRRALTKAAFGLYLPLAGLVAGPALLGVRLVELLERDIDTGAPSDQVLDAIEAREDILPKNVVTLIFPVKRSWFRRTIMHLVLTQAETGCRHFWTDGRLVRIETIHYARLFLTPSRRTMIFMSDYDGALDRYLDDFIGVGRRAVVPISSSIHGCPPTKWLGTPVDMSVFRGRWRTLIRRHQHLEAFWYTAYPDLETDQIRNHFEVRQGLFASSMTDEQAQAWLRRL